MFELKEIDCKNVTNSVDSNIVRAFSLPRVTRVSEYECDAVDSCRLVTPRCVLVYTLWYFNPCLTKEGGLWPLRVVLLRLW